MSEVIRQFKQKINDSTYSSPIYLGAYPQFVGALRQSNNTNLEEQLILGTDCITIETWELDENNNTVHKIVKEFHDGTQAKPVDYYKLVSEIYDEITEFKVNNKILTLTSINGEESKFFSVKRETLSYIDKNQKEIKISTKTITQTRENNKIITKEVIKNEKV